AHGDRPAPAVRAALRVHPRERRVPRHVDVTVDEPGHLHPVRAEEHAFDRAAFAGEKILDDVPDDDDFRIVDDGADDDGDWMWHMKSLRHDTQRDRDLCATNERVVDRRTMEGRAPGRVERGRSASVVRCFPAAMFWRMSDRLVSVVEAAIA